ncbi:hypothetical protein QJ857_gp1312 [Tupanvirus soda lake]|uniref:Uncharacterized protein n=2 Tax=Tupanvirus TaxID=2094720 RepID=A0A6N1NK85_9VIRU|nr:hypothetical protein QJ857_gp1312 [Tupanvirus soda lake]QKU34750.1 hypothetical protein [Tupanvirus soda lake]
MQNLGKDNYQVKVNIVDCIKPFDLTIFLIPRINKYLFIETIESFDAFTQNYGILNEYGVINIKWNLVSKDFKGIGISSELVDDRYLVTYFFGKEYPSWWNAEYYFEDFIEFSNVKLEDVNQIITTKSLTPTTNTIIDSECSDSDENSSNNFNNTKPSPNKVRYFKLIDTTTGKASGRYTGNTPKQAASKSFTSMLQKFKTNGIEIPQKIIIYLGESTRGSSRKIYAYEASRVKLPEPLEFIIRDQDTGESKTIVYLYRNQIKKISVPLNLKTC